MLIIHTVEEMQACARDMRAAGQSIGFVPTMGSLHQGHLSLIDLAHNQSDSVIVSIFVNPTQFAANEDFDAYPRVLERDITLCQTKNVAIVFAPNADAIYPEGYSTFVEETTVSAGLCGRSRPQHFRGVATICLKLFNIIQPDYAIFGQKDAQQCAVICKLVRDLNLNLKILTAPIVRDPDGLALSSRNAYLSPSQRTEALTLYRALKIAKAMVNEQNIRSVDRVVAEVTHYLTQARRIRVIYVELVDRNTLQAAREIKPGQQVLLLATWLEQVRLIDNILI
jgi:pantoate--beta-alanine ligase